MPISPPPRGSNSKTENCLSTPLLMSLGGASCTPMLLRILIPRADSSANRAPVIHIHVDSQDGASRHKKAKDA